jgi:hypothetical protein
MDGAVTIALAEVCEAIEDSRKLLGLKISRRQIFKHFRIHTEVKT